MTVAWLCAQLGLAVAAALAAGTRPRRRIVTALLVSAGATLPCLAPPDPLLRASLALIALVTFLKTTQVASAPGLWPTRRRLWHLVSLCPMSRGRSLPSDSSGLAPWNATLHGGLAAVALLLLSGPLVTTGPVHAAVRLAAGVLLLYSLMEVLSELTRLSNLAAGIEVRANQQTPVLARSAQEFWGRRWNGFVSEWLHRFVFLPLARRRRPALGLFLAFVVSAALHAFVAGVALGLRPALAMGTFFVVEGLIVVAETGFDLGAWPEPAARLWTVLVVLGPSPLGIDPFLRALGL